MFWEFLFTKMRKNRHWRKVHFRKNMLKDTTLLVQKMPERQLFVADVRQFLFLKLRVSAICNIFRVSQM